MERRSKGEETEIERLEMRKKGWAQKVTGGYAYCRNIYVYPLRGADVYNKLCTAIDEGRTHMELSNSKNTPT